MTTNEHLTITRRGLVKAGGVVVGLAGAGMLAAQAHADETPEATAEEKPSFLTDVEIDDSKIVETVEADAVVVGMGIAGVAAVRTLAEEGKKVAFLEKCDVPQGRSGDFGAINAELGKQYEMTGLDTNEIVAELMKESGYRTDYRILKAWADNSGADLDWYFGALEDLTYLPYITSPAPEADYWVQPERYPLPELWEGNADEYYPCYQTTVRMYPSHEPALNANLAKAEETGNVVAEHFDTSALKLLGDAKGGITGVIGQKAGSDELVQVNAKAVILATGDISGNKEMLHYYAPQTDGIMALFPPTAPDGGVPNTGDGQRMGMLAGAVLEEGPYAPMIHHMGACMGSACFLQLNRDGQRFMNEDIPGQQLENQIEAQPGRTTWQFFDSGWKDQVPHFKPEHGAVCYVLEDGEINNGEINNTLTCLLYTSPSPRRLPSSATTSWQRPVTTMISARRHPACLPWIRLRSMPRSSARPSCLCACAACSPTTRATPTTPTATLCLACTWPATSWATASRSSTQRLSPASATPCASPRAASPLALPSRNCWRKGKLLCGA